MCCIGKMHLQCAALICTLRCFPHKTIEEDHQSQSYYCCCRAISFLGPVLFLSFFYFIRFVLNVSASFIITSFSICEFHWLLCLCSFSCRLFHVFCGSTPRASASSWLTGVSRPRSRHFFRNTPSIFRNTFARRPKLSQDCRKTVATFRNTLQHNSALFFWHV